MAKTKVYLRIGKVNNWKYITAVSATSTNEPLKDGHGTRRKSIPTVFLALDLSIPDEAFQPPNICASINIPVEKVQPCIEVLDPLKIMGASK